MQEWKWLVGKLLGAHSLSFCSLQFWAVFLHLCHLNNTLKTKLNSGNLIIKISYLNSFEMSVIKKIIVRRKCAWSIESEYLIDRGWHFGYHVCCMNVLCIRLFQLVITIWVNSSLLKRALLKVQHVLWIHS